MDKRLVINKYRAVLHANMPEDKYQAYLTVGHFFILYYSLPYEEFVWRTSWWPER